MWTTMELLTAITEIIRDLLIFVAVMTALLIALIVIVSKMPDSNPLKRLLVALTYRVGATAAAGAAAIPIEPIPGLDACTILSSPFCWSGTGGHSFGTRAVQLRCTRRRGIRSRSAVTAP
jgi:hypothetical protein